LFRAKIDIVLQKLQQVAVYRRGSGSVTVALPCDILVKG
jgi:hypothetical protein